MAISRDKKNSVVDDLKTSLDSAKLTAFAKYEGLTVADLQQLRRTARENGVAIKVVKNRLVRIAMQQSTKFKDTDGSSLKGQLLYAMSQEDETIPAQTLAKFAKNNEALVLLGGLSNEGKILNEADIKTLAFLPSKNQLRAQLVGMLNAPVASFVSVIAANNRSILNILNARSETIK